MGRQAESASAGPRQVSAWLGQRWPSAVCDAVEVEDPIAETLRRAIGGGQTLAGVLHDLGGRSGRAQRAAHLWVAVASVVIAGLLGFIAWGLWSRGSAWEDKVTEYDTQRNAIIQNNLDVIRDARLAVPELEGAVRAAEQRLTPLTTGVTIRPVLEEFETLTLVLAGPGIDLRDLSVSGTAGVSATVLVDDVASYERLTFALKSVSGSMVEWREPDIRRVANRTEVNYTGLWRNPVPPAAGASGGGP